jgi:hypothetical protein
MNSECEDALAIATILTSSYSHIVIRGTLPKPRELIIVLTLLAVFSNNHQHSSSDIDKDGPLISYITTHSYIYPQDLPNISLPMPIGVEWPSQPLDPFSTPEMTWHSQDIASNSIQLQTAEGTINPYMMHINPTGLWDGLPQGRADAAALPPRALGANVSVSVDGWIDDAIFVSINIFTVFQ